jgi:hypothetical protein
MSNMLEQLQSLKERMDETRERLEEMTVEGEAGSGTVKVKMTGNRVVKNICIDPLLMESEKEEIEDLITIALNRALEKADKINETEMQNSAQSLLPGLGF